MAQQNINIGEANAKTGDTLFDAFTKTQANFSELYNAFLFNVVTINSEEDFPDQTATTITLKAQTKYVIGSPITTAKNFIAEDGAAMEGASQAVISMTYSGAGAMFTAQGSFVMNQFAFFCPNATIISASTPGAFVIINSCACGVCLQIGDIASSNMLFYDSIIVDCTIGLTFSGSNCQLITSGTRLQTSNPATTFIDLGTAVFDVLRITTTEIFGVPGAVCISGLGKDNVVPNGRAAVDVSGLSGGGVTALSGFDEYAVRWQFSGCTGVSDSKDAGDLFLENGSETINTLVAGTFYEIGTPTGGTNWNSDVENRFEFSTDGYITYIGERDIDVTVMSTATVSKVGGGSDIIEMRIAKNWVGGDNGLSKSKSQTQNPQPTSITSVALVSLSPNDTIRPIFSNNGSTSDIVVEVTGLVATG